MDNDYTSEIVLKKVLKNLVILYIEDEDEIRNNLEQTLQLIFKKVISTENAENALQLFHNNKVDIILSDINLPNKSGIDFIKDIRETNYTIPAILLTAYTDKEFLLEATQLKLINYLTKPIVFDELMETFLNAAKEIIRNGMYLLEFENNITYDVINSLLFENNIEQDLSTNERKLLELFINNQNRTVKTEEIKSYIWNDDEKATETALKSLLNKLRKKIGQNSIKNVSGIGYHLVTL